MLIQDARADQDPVLWMSDRDYGVALISCSNLTSQIAARCQSEAGAGTYFNDCKSFALWLSDARLSENMDPDSVVDLATFIHYAQPELIEKVKYGLQQVQAVCEHSKKRRRINNICSKISFVAANAPPDLTASFPLTDVGRWLVSGAVEDLHSAVPMRPGLGDRTQSLRMAMSRLFNQLKAKAWEETRMTPGVVWRAGNLWSGDPKDGTSRIFLPRVRYLNPKENAKHRLVWIADLYGLQKRLQELKQYRTAHFDLEACGKWSFVVRQSGSQISVKPKISELPLSTSSSSNRVVLMFGPDLHRYTLIYNAICNALKLEDKDEAALNLASSHDAEGQFNAGQGRDPQLFERTILLRTLLGLDIPESPIASAVFGSNAMRDALFSRVQDDIGVTFSNFQRKCILEIDKRITHWSFVAGAGKTAMLVAVALMASTLEPHKLVCMCAGSNAIAAVLEAALLKIMAKKHVLRLQVATEGDEFQDLGQLWLAKRLDEVMHVETLLLKAIDNSLHILTHHGHFLSAQDDQHQLCKVRALIRWILAVRHEYLHAHFYSRAAEVEGIVMDEVKVLVVVGSTLNKINAGQSFWSDWFLKQSLGLLLIDELPGQSIEEVSAQVINFPAVIMAGDQNQFLTEHKQTPPVSRLDEHVMQTFGNKGPQPLNRHNAAEWVENVSKWIPANATSISGFFQYRYGGDTLECLKYVFHDQLEALSCPASFHNTMILPYFFKQGFGADAWTYSRKTSAEILRSRPIFANCLAIVASEMVLAEARGCPSGTCQVLLMWCLKAPLNQLLMFLDAYITHACRELHYLLGIAEPRGGYTRTYALLTWINTQRFQAKAGQNAHGSHSEVALWFLCKRRREDRGWRGEQTYRAYLFEQSSRATLRQHVFIEDLSSEEVLPREEPYWTEGYKLGLCKQSNYSSTASTSVGKRTLTVLRFIHFLQRSLLTSHEFTRRDIQLYDCTSSDMVVPVFFRSPRCLELFAAERAICKSLFDISDPMGIPKYFSKCREFYDSMRWPSSEPSIQDNSYVSTVADTFSEYKPDTHTQWCWRWLKFLASEEKSPCPRILPEYDELRCPKAYVDFKSWSQIVLPTMNVHLLGLHKRAKDNDFWQSPSAMHHCNICIPYSSKLFQGIWDPNVLIGKLVDLVLQRYSASARGRVVLRLGTLSKIIVHHKKKEYEMGGLRFIVSQCASDRPASVLLFSPHADTPGLTKPIEMLHWYVAMGLNKQHPMQQVMLCRLRDFEMAKVVVDVIKTQLKIDHMSVRALSKNAEECGVMLKLWRSSSFSFPCAQLLNTCNVKKKSKQRMRPHSRNARPFCTVFLEIMPRPTLR